MKQLFSLLIFISIYLNCFGQRQIIDSLIVSINSAKNDTAKVNSINRLSRFYIYYQPHKASEYAMQAKKIAEEINYQKGLANSYLNLGFFAYRIDDYQSSINLYNKAIGIFKNNNNEIGLGYCYQLLAKTTNGLGNYSQSMEYLIKAIEYFDDANHPKGKGRVYETMGDINDTFENFEAAEENLIKSIQLKQEYNDYEELPRSYAYLGNVYLHIGSRKKGLVNFKEALRISKKTYNQNTESYVLTRMGDFYLDEKKYKRSKEYYQLSLNITNKHENNWGIIRNLKGISQSLYNQKNYKESIIQLNKTIETANRINDKRGIKEAYELLYKIYEDYDSIDKAYKYYKLYSIYKDSLFNNKTTSNISILQKQYKSDKEKSELLIVQDEKRKRNTIIFSFVILVIILLTGFVFLLFSRLTGTRKKKKEIEKQKLIVDEKNREITDSLNYAKKIQEAILKSDDYIASSLPNSFIFFQPKELVSGDFYWVYKKKDFVFFTVADCTGHGVPGAFMSMIGNSLLNEMIIDRGIENTNVVMDNISNQIKISLDQTSNSESSRDGIDMMLCRLNMKTKELMYTGAKNPLYLIRDNELIEYPGDNRPIGYFVGKGIKFTSTKITLKDNDLIYLFSDGFSDQFGGSKNRKYMIRNFKKFLIKISRLSIENQKIEIEKELNNWKGNNEQIDDICIMGVQISSFLINEEN